ncbi:MAG: hypothetical protein ACO2Z9_03485 [Crocinitomicaceae bacterium]
MKPRFLNNVNVLFVVFAVLAFSTLLNSCSSSHNVSSNGFIQKRKYNKGWYIKSRQRVKSSSESKSFERLRSDKTKITEEKEVNTLLPHYKAKTEHSVKADGDKEIEYSLLNNTNTPNEKIIKVSANNCFNKSVPPGKDHVLKDIPKLLPTLYFPGIPMTPDEKGQLAAIICLLVSLLLIALFCIHLSGIWIIPKAGLVIMWIALLTVAAAAIIKNEEEVNRLNMRPSFRAINSIMHWFFKVSLVLIIVFACLIILMIIISAIIFFIGVTDIIITTLGITIGVTVITLFVICGILYFLEMYPELFWATTLSLFLGILLYSIYLAATTSLLLAVLSYVFLIGGAILAILYIILSISDLI